MAALPAGALLGTDQKPTGTDAQGGGLQSQTTGGHPRTARRIEPSHPNRLVARKKNKNHDELEGDKLISATSCFDCNISVSKTTPFADISKVLFDKAFVS